MQSFPAFKLFDRRLKDDQVEVEQMSLSGEPSLTVVDWYTSPFDWKSIFPADK